MRMLINKKTGTIEVKKRKPYSLLIKGKKMPIGTISKGRKKVGENKWVPVKKGAKPGVKEEGKKDVSKVKNYIGNYIIEEFGRSKNKEEFEKDFKNAMIDLPASMEKELTSEDKTRLKKELMNEVIIEKKPGVKKDKASFESTYDFKGFHNAIGDKIPEPQAKKEYEKFKKFSNKQDKNKSPLSEHFESWMSSKQRKRFN